MERARPYRISGPPEDALERMVLGAPVAVPATLWDKLVRLGGFGEPSERVLLYEGGSGRWLVRKG